MGPPMPSRGPTASPADSSMSPPEAPMPGGAPGGGLGGPPSGEPSLSVPGEAPSLPAAESSGVGKYIAIGLAVLAGGGLLYYATTRQPSPPPRSRSRREFVPPRASRTASAAMARSMPAQEDSELEFEE